MTKNIKILAAIMLVFVFLPGCAATSATTVPLEIPESGFSQSGTPKTQAAQQPVAIETPLPTLMPTPAPTYAFPIMPGGYLEKAVTGEFTGATVIVDGSFSDIDTIKLKKSLRAFEEATGISVEYIGGPDFQISIDDRVAAGNPPDIADFPHPNQLAHFVQQGMIVDPTLWISAEWLGQQYEQSWLDMARIAGQSSGLWHRFLGKSLVWYPQDDFEAAGYEVPSTWDEMLTLMDSMVADGSTPWCIGIESGQATGWPAADWLADLVLRTTSAENYDSWTTGELPFLAPQIRLAAESMAEIWFEDTYVYSGTANIAYTFFGDSPTPLFENPPECWFHRQGPIITGFFPDDAQVEVDFGVFLLPEIDPAFGRPFLVTGDLMAMFNDRPEVRALMEYFTTSNSVAGWMESGGALAAHRSATPQMYTAELEASIARLVPQVTSFHYAASALMPSEVSASFWQGMTDWVSGRADLEPVLSEIDASWPLP